MNNYDRKKLLWFSVERNHNPNCSCIPDYIYRIFIIGASGSLKTNVLLNVIKQWRPDIDKNYLYVKDSLEWKYQLLIKGREKVGTENLKNPKPKHSLIIHKKLMMFVKIWKTMNQQRKGEC